MFLTIIGSSGKQTLTESLIEISTVVTLNVDLSASYFEATQLEFACCGYSDWI